MKSNIEYCCGELSPTAPTPARICCLNTGVSPIDILECIFGVGLCESNVDNDISLV